MPKRKGRTEPKSDRSKLYREAQKHGWVRRWKDSFTVDMGSFIRYANNVPDDGIVVDMDKDARGKPTITADMTDDEKKESVIKFIEETLKSKVPSGKVYSVTFLAISHDSTAKDKDGFRWHNSITPFHPESYTSDMIDGAIPEVIGFRPLAEYLVNLYPHPFYLFVKFVERKRERGRPRKWYTPQMFNCVIEAFIKALNKNGKKDKRTRSLITKLQNFDVQRKLVENGVDYDITALIAKMANLNCIILDLSRKPIFEFKGCPKRKTVVLVADGKHITYIPQQIECDATLMSVFSRKNSIPEEDRIIYSYNMQEDIKNDKSAFKYFMSTNGKLKNAQAYIAMDVDDKTQKGKYRAYVVKSATEFPHPDSNFEDMQREGTIMPEKDRSYYKYQLSNVGCLFKDIDDKYHLSRNLKPDQIHLKQAQKYMPDISYVKDQSKLPTYGFDQNRSYSSYRTSPYYKKYKFPRFGTTIKIPDDAPYQPYLDHSGFGLITDFDASGCNSVIRDCLYRMIHPEEDCVTTMELSRFLHYGATFTLKAVILDFDPLDLEDAIMKFPKLKANMIVGKMVPRKKVGVSVQCKNIDDFQDIIYNNFDRIIGNDPKEKVVSIESNLEPHKFYDIHAYILGYSKLALMDKLNIIDPVDVCKIKCDALYVRNFDKWSHLFKMSGEIGDWKREEIKPIQSTIFASQHVSLSKPPDQYHNPLFDTLTDLKPQSPEFLAQVTIITALRAGAGKTAYVLKYNLPPNSLYIAPTKPLTRRMGKLYRVPATTVHKFLGRVPKDLCGTGERRDIMKKKAKKNMLRFAKYGTVVYDEASMNGQSMLKKVIIQCRSQGQKLVIIHDPKQLNPIQKQGQGRKKVLPLGDILSYDELKGVTVQEKTLKTAHRYLKFIGGHRFVNLLDKYRDQPISQTIADNFKDFKHTQFQNDKNKILTDILDGGIILSPLKYYRDHYNDTLYALTPDTAKIPILVSEPTKGYVKGDRLYIPKTEYQAFTPQLRQKLILAYSATVHITQGDTFIKQIYIDTHRIDFDLNLFYTAITRAERYDQIRVLD